MDCRHPPLPWLACLVAVAGRVAACRVQQRHAATAGGTFPARRHGTVGGAGRAGSARHDGRATGGGGTAAPGRHGAAKTATTG